jgi:hypothetical protein
LGDDFSSQTAVYNAPSLLKLIGTYFIARKLLYFLDWSCSSMYPVWQKAQRSALLKCKGPDIFLLPKSSPALKFKIQKFATKLWPL